MKMLGDEIRVNALFGETPDSTSSLIERQMVEEIQAARLVVADDEVSRWNRRLLEAKECEGALSYLVEERGLTHDTILHAMIGWVSTPNKRKDEAEAEPVRRGRTRSGRRAPPSSTEVPARRTPGWLTIPVCDRWLAPVPRFGRKQDPNACVLVKCRNLSPNPNPKYSRMKGGQTALYAPGGIDASKTLIIVGGELDALSVWQAGWRNVASGSGGEGAWKDEWTRQLSECEDIVVIYDNDKAGRVGAENVINHLGKHRCRIGQWPESYKDANETLLGLGEDFNEETLKGIIDTSDQVKQEGLGQAADVWDEMEARLKDDEKVHGIQTGLRDFDDLLGGFRWHEVTVVTGGTGGGKSTFVSQIALDIAKLGHGVLMSPFEIGKVAQLTKWVRQYHGQDPLDLTREQLVYLRAKFTGLPLYQFRHDGGEIEPDVLRETLLFAYHRLGVRLFVIDHIHFLVDEGDGEYAKLSAYMKMFVHLVLAQPVHVIVVAHPKGVNKGDRKGNDDDVVYQLSHIKGASSIKQGAFNGLSVYRRRTKNRENNLPEGYGEAAIVVLKCRSQYGNEGGCALRFNKRSERFENDDHGPNMVDLATNYARRHPQEKDDDD